MIQIFRQKNELPLTFIKQKINELQTALFFAISNTVLKIPSHVVMAAEADEEGRIWFAVPKPSQSVCEFDKKFPAKLDFFKKGKEFFLKIEGNASIMTEPDEIKMGGPIIEQLMLKLKSKQIIIIQIEIQKADYFEAKSNLPKSRTNSAKSQLYNWFTPAKQGPRQLQLLPIPIYRAANNQG
jgi:general stress protein 26